MLHTEMQVREDAIRLIGFATAEERDWFRLLTSVQGVGARVALAILSALAADELHRAVASGDKAMVARAQGVGPKLAQRIVNELKDKAGGIALGAAAAAPPPRRQPAADAVSALAQSRLPPGRGRRRGRRRPRPNSARTRASTRWSAPRSRRRRASLS